MSKSTHMVVSSWDGGIYSRHMSETAAEAAAKKVIARLRHPNCGSLASYIAVVPTGSRYTHIVPASNDYGCVQIRQARWVTPAECAAVES